jgi:hypothetical protein
MVSRKTKCRDTITQLTDVSAEAHARDLDREGSLSHDEPSNHIDKSDGRRQDPLASGTHGSSIIRGCPCRDTQGSKRDRSCISIDFHATPMMSMLTVRKLYFGWLGTDVSSDAKREIARS